MTGIMVQVKLFLHTETSPGVFQATHQHYTHQEVMYAIIIPQSTLIVNGVVCTSSSQEQIVTVWDDDDHNGGHMHINPEVYPICVGNGADVRFQDLTQFNCVPPQERDNPNVNTRWIQWTYGTAITMTGIPVTINGTPRTFPYSGSGNYTARTCYRIRSMVRCYECCTMINC